MAERAKLDPPRMIGRYEVIAEIAQGGMGVVYLARHAGEAGFQRLFAIKLMHAHLAEERMFVDMLRDEARIAAHIHHPNVVPIVDFGQDEGLYYAVMEYIDGCSFSALLGRNRQARPAGLVVPVLIDALEGLHAAHTLNTLEGTELKLVHRDVSPQNILVGADGIGRITDFGIAKAETRITSTQPGIRKGKISYMAPEQIQEDGEHVDHRADVFAAGAVLWGALTGGSLFRGASDGATLHAILHKAVPPPSEAGLKPPAVFDAICLRALERNPDKRFQSALEMAEALRDALGSLGIKSSRAELATWVKGSFSAELSARNQAIRTVMQRSSPPDPDESLPALPDLGAPPSLRPQARPSTPPTSLSSVAASHSVPPGTDGRARKRLVVAGGIALVSIAAWLGWLLFLPSAGEPPVAAANAPPSAVAAASPVPSAALPEPEPVPEVQLEDLPAPAEPAKSTASGRAPRKTARAAVDKPPPAASPAPPPPAAPATQSSPGMKLETNPYLRRE
jgi:eukaryotic-like serine/threonine-protein kinase